MASILLQFYRNGTDNQKRADITVNLKRPDLKNFENWTEEQKQAAKNFMSENEKIFQTFKSVIDEQ